MKVDIVAEAKTKRYHLRYWEPLTRAAKKNRKKETESEKILWQILRKKNLGVKFSRQKPIGRFIVDFYCAELCLVIEVDGTSHNIKKGRDINRDRYLKACGINTLRFENELVINNLNEVRRILNDFVDRSPVKGSCL